MSLFSVARWGVLGLTLACSAVPPAQLVRSTPQPVRESRAPSELVASIRSLRGEHSVLSALPSGLRQRLNSGLSRLSESQRIALLSGNGGLSSQRPLLHLAAGGSLPSAYSSMLSAPNVVGELLELSVGEDGQPSIGPSFATLLVEIERRAAFALLRQLTPEGVAELEPEHWESVATAARAIGGTFSADVAAELLRRGPSGIYELHHASALAHLRRAGDANLSFRRAKTQPGTAAPWMTSLVQREVSAATQLEQVQTSDTNTAVQRARALLQLNDRQGALQELNAVESASHHLGFQIARHEARFGSLGCGMVPRHLRTPHVCRAVHIQQAKSVDWSLLKAAWQSGVGRDVLAVEGYMALSFVLPMTYGLDTAGNSGSVDSYLEHVNEFANTAKQAVTTSPHFDGMAAFAQVLANAFRASVERETPRGAPNEQTRSRLAQLELMQSKTASVELWSQAARIAVAALLVQDVNPETILQRLVPTLLPRLSSVHGALSTWNALSRRGLSPLRATARQRIVDTWSSRSPEHLQWRLTFAEADAYREPGPKSHAVLRGLAEQALVPAQSLGLRLRGGLSMAGLEARAGRFGKAWFILDGLLTEAQSAVQTRDQQELLVAAQGYHLLLDVLRSPPAAKKFKSEALDRFLLKVEQAEAASRSVQIWLAAWRVEVAFRIAEIACGGNGSCATRAKKARGLPREELVVAAGEGGASLLEQGRLALGGLSLELSWSQDEARLAPRVQLTPRFPYVHFPKVIVKKTERME